MDVLGLKKKYGKIFCVELHGIEIIFRLPSWKEYKRYSLLFERRPVTPAEVSDSIFESCVLSEEIKDKMFQLPAGIVDSIVSLIMFMAGNPLQDEEDVERLNYDIDVVREVITSNIYDQITIIICQAFPSFRPADVEEMDWPEVLRHLLMAENILGRRGEIERPVNIFPREEQTKQESLATQIMKDTKSLAEDNPDIAKGSREQRTQEMFDRVMRSRQES